jgi:hypothetical protein
MRFLVVLATVLALSGCSLQHKQPKAQFTGTKADVAAAITLFQQAAKAGDESKICTQVLTTAFAASLGGRRHCADTVGNVLDDTDGTQLAIAVKRIALGRGARPTTAKAVITSGSGSHQAKGALALVKQGGTWRIDHIY